MSTLINSQNTEYAHIFQISASLLTPGFNLDVALQTIRTLLIFSSSKFFFLFL